MRPLLSATPFLPDPPPLYILNFRFILQFCVPSFNLMFLFVFFCFFIFLELGNVLFSPAIGRKKKKENERNITRTYWWRQHRHKIPTIWIIFSATKEEQAHPPYLLCPPDCQLPSLAYYCCVLFSNFSPWLFFFFLFYFQIFNFHLFCFPPDVVCPRQPSTSFLLFSVSNEVNASQWPS